jgi:hypothetical protein
MTTKPLTLDEAKAIISHTEDTKRSITEFIALFANGVALSDVYAGGKYRKTLNATRVFGGYLSGALKIEPTKWADYTSVFFKMPEDVSALISMGVSADQLLSTLGEMQSALDNATDERNSARIASGAVHKSAVASITKAREAFVKAGVPADEAVKLLSAEVEKLNSLLVEARANTELVSA